MRAHILIAFVVLSIFLTACSSEKPAGNGDYTEFAKCLTANDAKMYGAYWCPHCQNQKKMFGDAVQYVNYIECDDNGSQAKVCADAGIKGYPTWVFKSGEQVAGEVSVVDLSEKSGCSLDLIKL